MPNLERSPDNQPIPLTNPDYTGDPISGEEVNQGSTEEFDETSQEGEQSQEPQDQQFTEGQQPIEELSEPQEEPVREELPDERIQEIFNLHGNDPTELAKVLIGEQEAHGKTTKSYKSLEGEFTRRSQKLAELEKSSEKDEIVDSGKLDFGRLLETEPAEEYTEENFRKDAIDEYGSFKDPTTVFSAFSKLANSIADKKSRASSLHTRQVTTMELQQNQIFDKYPEEAKKYYKDFIEYTKNPNASMMDAFEFYMFKKGIHEDKPDSKGRKRKPNTTDDTLTYINKNVHRQGSLAGVPEVSDIRSLTKEEKKAEEFFGERL